LWSAFQEKLAKPSEKEAMAQAVNFAKPVALLATGLATGAALYITLVEHPTFLSPISSRFATMETQLCARCRNAGCTHHQWFVSTPKTFSRSRLTIIMMNFLKSFKKFTLIVRRSNSDCTWLDCEGWKTLGGLRIFDALGGGVHFDWDHANQ